MENSKRLGQQAQPGIESGTSRLPALSVEPLRHWWGNILTELRGVVRCNENVCS